MSQCASSLPNKDIKFAFLFGFKDSTFAENKSIKTIFALLELNLLPEQIATLFLANARKLNDQKSKAKK